MIHYDFLLENTRMLVRMVADLRLQIRNIYQRIDRITPITKISFSTERLKKYLPLKSIDDIKAIENRLQQEDFAEEYVSKQLKPN